MLILVVLHERMSGTIRIQSPPPTPPQPERRAAPATAVTLPDVEATQSGFVHQGDCLDNLAGISMQEGAATADEVGRPPRHSEAVSDPRWFLSQSSGDGPDTDEQGHIVEAVPAEPKFASPTLEEKIKEIMDVMAANRDRAKQEAAAAAAELGEPLSDMVASQGSVLELGQEVGGPPESQTPEDDDHSHVEADMAEDTFTAGSDVIIARRLPKTQLRLMVDLDEGGATTLLEDDNGDQAWESDLDQGDIAAVEAEDENDDKDDEGAPSEYDFGLGFEYSDANHRESDDQTDDHHHGAMSHINDIFSTTRLPTPATLKDDWSLGTPTEQPGDVSHSDPGPKKTTEKVTCLIDELEFACTDFQRADVQSVPDCLKNIVPALQHMASNAGLLLRLLDSLATIESTTRRAESLFEGTRLTKAELSELEETLDLIYGSRAVLEAGIERMKCQSADPIANGSTLDFNHVSDGAVSMPVDSRRVAAYGTGASTITPARKRSAAALDDDLTDPLSKRARLSEPSGRWTSMVKQTVIGVVLGAGLTFAGLASLGSA